MFLGKGKVKAAHPVTDIRRAHDTLPHWPPSLLFKKAPRNLQKSVQVLAVPEALRQRVSRWLIVNEQ